MKPLVRIYGFEEELRPGEHVTILKDGYVLYEYIVPSNVRARLHVEMIIHEGVCD